MTNEPKKPRGFAAITPERRREIASMGGKASPGNFKNDPKRAARLARQSKPYTKQKHDT